ncbi:hypothetical protein SCLCIDRAFT_1225228 [Scleroderma citrinum Foug A]|uniref:Uncharacterized protein n=1 Tax=Scleroderma citrinum Foug A TaxID=1036808 RepID=A0A0C3D3G7_9AGAM|nr:hypothetical protein SCLCIDRAFT_1225228 [Scleroderma citrinum Foug A]
MASELLHVFAWVPKPTPTCSLTFSTHSHVLATPSDSVSTSLCSVAPFTPSARFYTQLNDSGNHKNASSQHRAVPSAVDGTKMTANT